MEEYPDDAVSMIGQWTVELVVFARLGHLPKHVGHLNVMLETLLN